MKKRTYAGKKGFRFGKEGKRCSCFWGEMVNISWRTGNCSGGKRGIESVGAKRVGHYLIGEKRGEGKIL